MIALLTIVLAASQAPVASATSPEWLRLLHFAGNTSSVQSGDFFLSPEGMKDPGAEMAAFLRLAQGGPAAEEARCKYPARWKWMVAAGLLTDAHPDDFSGCGELQMFLRDARPRSVWIVFVAYYQFHPASLFGHTLLLFPRGDLDRDGIDLGSHAATFEADVTGLSAMTYIPAGLFGGLPSRFRLEPFHVKAGKYGNTEKRDLWLFDLRLTLDETTLLLLHLWELRTATFDYGWVRTNCSFQLLAAMEAVLPGRELTSQLGLMVSPADTLRVLEKEIGIRRTRVLRSPATRLRYAVSRLSAADRARLDPLLNAGDAPDAVLSADVLDAALLHYQVNHPYTMFPRPSATAEEERYIEQHRRLVALRSRAPPRSPADTALVAPDGPGANPIRGHALSRASMLAGRSSVYAGFVEIDFRAAIHDLGDAATGFPPGMVLELARVDLHFALAPQTVVLREASIVKVGALGAGPDQGFELRPAWQLGLGAAPVPLSGVGPRTRLPTQAGASTEFGGAFGNRSLFVFSLVGAHAGALIADRTTFSPLLSWKAGMQVGPADRWTSTLSARCVAVGYSGELLARRGCEGRLDAAVEISRLVTVVGAGSLAGDHRDIALGLRHYW